MFSTPRRVCPQHLNAPEVCILAQRQRGDTASDQRAAFAAVKDELSDLLQLVLDPSKDLELREESRQASGLPLLPSFAAPTTLTVENPSTVNEVTEPRLLDVEIVAIYW